MGKQGTRVEITADLHTLLENKLDYLKSKGGATSITLKKLVEQLCRAGLAYQEEANKPGVGKHQTDRLGIHYPPNAEPKEYIFESRRELISMRDEIRKRELSLRALESHLDRREEKVNEKLYKAIGIREENIRQQEEGTGRRGSPDESKGDRTEELKRSIKELEDKNRSLKEDNISLKEENSIFSKEKRETLGEINSKLNIIQSNTRQDVFTDTILPLATPILVAYLHFQKNKGKDGGEDINPLAQKLNDIFSHLDEKDKKAVDDILEQLVMKYAHQEEEE